jgi:CDP-glucose 4,6-dehydratase
VESLRVTPFWRDRATLVTGATGLVGGALVRQLLAQQADVVCLVRDWVPQADLVQSGNLDRVKVVRGDLGDQELLERVLGEYEIASVFHLAAQTIVPIANRNPISTFESNIGGTWRLLEACRRSPLVKQIVLASSDKAYGSCETLPYDETTPLQGRHPYDVSKSCADLIAQSYAETYQLPVVVTRCGNFFGGGDLNWNRIIPGTIRSILRGQQPLIRSDGLSVRDYLYVDDGAAAYLQLAEQLAARPELRGEAFNFSCERPLTVLQLVETLLELCGSTLEPEVRNEATNEIRHQYLSAAKARAWLGWTPRHGLEEGLRLTIDWYRRHLAATGARQQRRAA